MALLGIRYEEIDFGIAVDFVTSDISRYQSGSYELYVNYRLTIKAKGVVDGKY